MGRRVRAEVVAGCLRAECVTGGLKTEGAVKE
jgi:hypothetical protein